MRAKILRKLKAKKEAKEKIPQLLKKSKEIYKKDIMLSKTYSKKIKYLHMKYKIPLEKNVRRQLCKHCFSVLIPAVNCRIRLGRGSIVTYCSECKRYSRMPLKQKSPL